MRTLTTTLAVCALATACNQAVAPATRERIARDFEAGRLKPDVQGVVCLPLDLTGSSIGGRAFVTTNQNSAWLLLRTWRGKGGNQNGYLYAPGTALRLGSEVTLTTDAAGVIVSVESTVEKTVGGSWYIVHSGYD